VEHGPGKDSGLQPNYLKPSITVMDLTSLSQPSAFLMEAKRRGCDVVTPRRILLEQTILLLRLSANQEIAREKLDEVLAQLAPDEVE
jgi:hypothetical protein